MKAQNSWSVADSLLWKVLQTTAQALQVPKDQTIFKILESGK